jgi:hypothetical protein
MRLPKKNLKGIDRVSQTYKQYSYTFEEWFSSVRWELFIGLALFGFVFYHKIFISSLTHFIFMCLLAWFVHHCVVYVSKYRMSRWTSREVTPTESTVDVIIALTSDGKSPKKRNTEFIHVITFVKKDVCC